MTVCNRGGWAGLAAAMLLASAPAAAQAATASAQARGGLTIGVRIAVATRPDFVLGSARLRLAKSDARAIRPSGFRTVAQAVPASDARVTADHQASFVITGEAGRSLSIALPATVGLTRIGGSQIMRVAMTTSLADPGQTLLLPDRVTAAGLLAFSVGGQLLLDRDVVAGEYRGTVSATAQYN